MGPNGTGKSTLANVLMGHPSYVVTQGEILFEGVNLVGLAADARARLGLFLAFQYPVAIPGLSVANFLRAAINCQAQGRRSRTTKASPFPSSASCSKRRWTCFRCRTNSPGAT